jgi:hypothetical protein
VASAASSLLPLPQPREVWSQYSPGLSNLRHKVAAARAAAASGGAVDDDTRFQEDEARACLNHLVADALTLAPSCLRYLAALRHPDVFRFCAIPQVRGAVLGRCVTRDRPSVPGGKRCCRCVNC